MIISARIKYRLILLTAIALIHCIKISAQVFVGALDDSYIYQGGPKADNIYGLLDPDTLITRKSIYSAEFTREAYCMFEIGDQASNFSEAKLRLYGKVVEPKTVEIYWSDTTWSEETLTGRNRPPGTFLASKYLEAGEEYYSWDVTYYVNNARSTGANRISFVLKDVAGAVSTIDTKWHSKENPSGNGPVLALTTGDPPEYYSGNYYVDQVSGNDENSGHSPEEAWKTLAKVDNLLLQPGDSLLFRSGCEWTGTFSLKGSGLPGKNIVIGKYGGEERPVIHGAGLATNTITLNNQHHLVVKDLAVSNKDSVPEFRRAIYYHAADMGEIPYLVFDNLEIFDVNGLMGDEPTKDNGGIFIEITGSSIPTWFDTLVISNCYVHDVNRTGISNKSSWSSRTLSDNGNWIPSKNIHIHHNTFERTGANALIVRVAHKPVMEHNLFNNCSVIGSGNASFSFNTDSAIWQYNEACYTRYNEGDADAGGFDSDYRSKYTIIQYNYSHDNDYGGVLITGGPGTGDGFNEGTIVRYNVLANNKHHIIRTSGNATNAQIYNNVFYTGPELTGVYQVYHKSWGGYSDGVSYWNNIFYNEGTGSTFELLSSTNNVFSNNIYYGNAFVKSPSDPMKITDDPKLLNPGGNEQDFNGVFMYRITDGSSAIDKGLVIEGAPATDLAGSLVPFGSAPDIGAFEYEVTSDIPFPETEEEPGFNIYPNPVNDLFSMKIDSDYSGPIEIKILDVRMSVVMEVRIFKSPENGLVHVDTGRFGPGMYIIQLNMGEDIAFNKLIKL